jgi:hypothetical protein
VSSSFTKSGQVSTPELTKRVIVSFGANVTTVVNSSAVARRRVQFNNPEKFYRHGQGAPPLHRAVVVVEDDCLGGAEK